MIEAEHEGTWTPQHEHWFREAIDRYGARCLWNMKPRRTEAGLSAIADRLKKHGDMEAWKLACNIEAFLERRKATSGARRLRIEDRSSNSSHAPNAQRACLKE